MKVNMRLPWVWPAVLILWLGVVLAQTVALPASPATAVSKLTRLSLVAAYEKALLAQQTEQAAHTNAQAALAEWNAANKQAIADEKLPEGTVFSVDLTKTGDEVKAVLPPPPPPPNAKPITAPPPAKK